MTFPRRLEVEGPLPPSTSEDLAAIEAELGVPRPAEFVAFPAQANGGRLDNSIEVPVPGGSLPVCFHSLHQTAGRAPSGRRPARCSTRSPPSGGRRGWRGSSSH